MADLPPENAARLGRAIKRLVGDNPVRFRYAKENTKFLLSDCTDADAGVLVRSKDCLQLTRTDAAPLVIDVDSLNPGGDTKASSTAFAIQRLQVATRLLGVVLKTAYSLEVSWFSSGKQGVHGFCFGSQLTSPMRFAVSELLPVGPMEALELFEHSNAYSNDAVKTEVELGMKRLGALDLRACDDTKWVERMRRAMDSTASLPVKLLALTAFFDVGVTKASVIRLPTAFNDKETGFAGFPLPTEGEWPPLRRDATVALTEAELGVLETIPLPTASDLAATAAAIRSVRTQKRKRLDGAFHPLSYYPRNHPIPTALPTYPAKRAALIPAAIRARLPPKAIDALEDGMRMGGAPPSRWIPEADSDRRRKAASRGGGVGGAPGSIPLALDALVGLDLDSDGRGDVVKTLVASAFPVDKFADAMMACSSKMRQLDHWRSWFSTCAQGKAAPAAVTWRYDSGGLDEMGVLCPNVRCQCAKAASILGGRGGGGGVGGGSRRTRPAAASRTLTGRVLEVILPGTKAEVRAATLPLLRSRAEVESPETIQTFLTAKTSILDQNLAGIYDKYELKTDGTPFLTVAEYIQPDGRLGYTRDDWAGMKSVLKDLRHIIFSKAWSADLKRCHTAVLVGAHHRAYELGLVPQHALLDRMYHDLDGVEADLKADQQRLLPAAQIRLRHARVGSKAEDSAKKLVTYLQTEPKRLFSVLLNQNPSWSTFKDWPLANACCRAIHTAAAAAQSHPLVAADQFRPELMGTSHGDHRASRQISSIFERRALLAMIDKMESVGLPPSMTENDELFMFLPAGTDTEALRQTLDAAVAEKLQFRANVRLRAGGGIPGC